jgi:hypothetical protein
MHSSDQTSVAAPKLKPKMRPAPLPSKILRAARQNCGRYLHPLSCLLLLSLPLFGAEDSTIDAGSGRVHESSFGSLRGLSAPRLRGDDDIAFEAEVGLGFESNVFEVNGRYDNPVGDEFLSANLDLSVPIKEIGDEVRLDFNGTLKKYFRENQIDEYLLKPDLVFGGIDVGGATLELDGRVALLRERIFNDFGRIPSQSEPGASGGAGWNLESDISKTTTVTWTGEAEYQTFFNAPNDNIRVASEEEFKTSLNGNLELNAGANLEFQRYRVRPSDIESQLNPNALATLEGRGFVGLNSHFDGGYGIGAALNAGPNIDLTNGYYDAAVIGARAEIRRRIGNFKLTGSVEPELVWFIRRPANLGRSSEKLFTEEYVFEFALEYSWSRNVKLFCSEALHVQESSSDESKADAVLNSFINNSVKSGVIITF